MRRNKKTNRREFMRDAANAGIGAAMLLHSPDALGQVAPPTNLRIVRPGGRHLLTVRDLSWLGQVEAVGSDYVNPTLAIRYVNGERRFLTYDYTGNTGVDDAVGDLIEYRVAATLKNGTADWTLSNVPGWSEVRRWKNWSTHARILAGQEAGRYPWILRGGSRSANGAAPSSFYWDEAQGVLFYSWQPWYPGGEVIWPAFSAVRLLDSEAGGSVSAGNMQGPWYFRNKTLPDDFKDGACGIIPIPAGRQAAMGGKYLTVGHHCANVGVRGPNSLGMWVVPDLPNMSSPPPQDAVLWPNARHLYDTSLSAGIPAPNMKEPNVSFNACIHASQGLLFWFESGGVASAIRNGASVGTAVGDCLYNYDYYGHLDCITVLMNTGASGGSWVPEIYNGSAWVQPGGWAVSVGNVELSAPENVFYWPKVPQYDYNLPGVGTNSYVRLRRVAAGASGGSIKAMIVNAGVTASDPPMFRPKGVGGYSPPGTERYDDTHFAYNYEEFFWGGAWVLTDVVEGLAYFGVLSSGGVWYGAAPMYAQPDGGGVPVKYRSVAAREDLGNGGRMDGPDLPYFFQFNGDHLAEISAGRRAANNTGINPVSYAELHATFPGLIVGQTVPNPDSPWYGHPNHHLYGWGHSVVFDPATKQLIVLLTNGATWGRNILAFWQVP